MDLSDLGFLPEVNRRYQVALSQAVPEGDL